MQSPVGGSHTDVLLLVAPDKIIKIHILLFSNKKVFNDMFRFYFIFNLFQLENVEIKIKYVVGNFLVQDAKYKEKSQTRKI